MAVEVAVENSGEFGDADVVAGFFAGFSGSSGAGRLAHVGPATGKGPKAILELADQENSVVAEGGDADIDFRGGVAGLLREEIVDGGGTREFRARGSHLGGDVADFVVALDIEFVLAI
jgi:hypothetical protein